MKSVRRFTMLAFLVLALTGIAGAQGMTGNFTLPSETRWGPAILPAGEYSFTLGNCASNRALHIFRGRTGVAVLYATTWDAKAKGNNELVLEGNGEVKDVRQLSLPEIGIVLFYPASRKAEPMNDYRQIAMGIPVHLAAKAR